LYICVTICSAAWFLRDLYNSLSLVNKKKKKGGKIARQLFHEKNFFLGF